MIEFHYDGYHRKVEPYCHGTSKRGKESVRGYQVAGGSNSRSIPFWRLFTVAKIGDLSLTDETFQGNRPGYNPPEDCEAAQKNNSAFKCPSSRAPHHIRTGYITDQKNRGVSSDAIDQRCDVTPRVQDQHYDLPDDAEERERYDEEFRNADDDPNSGFNHD